ncbi:ATP-binding protein [Bradyrhizobium symbiodeficiens]|uniref:ATP-binding protein n=1 Tax=Bradyrhizobium symbiodeficiens TaxID=1404367 RepID=UPI00140FEEBE|nr:ATP-binding protein [Bradyrhizobium symbiodeficiens]QIP03938.1 ATP-binding protein [Bradyrhizobium symbiodeficiens]
MAPTVQYQKDPDEQQLVEKILASEDREHIVQTTLQTNEQVIARVTDGIYRQPASALRELISNAYDADATRVVIKTDVPRFDRIVIEDDGAGMSPKVLAHLLFNIGGSAKRNEQGESLGITSVSDPFKSPGGRRLIGKIGIGLFSVSQLTHSFQIITKTKGDDHRTVATIVLRQFSDSEVAPSHGDSRYESGKVTIWREKAADLTNHGTTIVLTSIRPQARDTLRSRDIWDAIEQNEQTTLGEERQAIEPPRFHVGRVDQSGKSFKPVGDEYTSLPWEGSDKPDLAFQKLVDCVWQQIYEANPNPKLERIFDYYLRMVWQLALAVPLPYVDGHIFDMPSSGWASSYELSNKAKGSASLIERNDASVRDILDLKDPAGQGAAFEVFIDNLKLARPIRFKNLPNTAHALKQPLVFIGKCDETFSKLKPELSGGRLKFEAYLFWSPKIAPTEHQGSLIRINGASGTLFDPTFMRYQVSEQNRLRQTTCEIFVSDGLDSALNIDRESFNNAHPHVVYLTRWLHGALRQLATIQKRAASEVRSHTREQSQGSRVGAIRQIASQVWTDQTDDPASSPPTVELVEDEKSAPRKSDAYVFKRSSVTKQQTRPKAPRERARAIIIDEQLKAIAQVLASFGLIDQLTKKKQEALLRAIHAILEEREG